MTEQMTGRQEAGASGRPPATAAGPSSGMPAPSPRDLASRSPHRDTGPSAPDQPQVPQVPAAAPPEPP
nr:hypothetical protein [Actinomycetota bacterium]